ncbi:MAG: DivIVA domain-containing protein [Actinomycetota bacterium]|nr:DivIVA domain-containing protein [Actinomycetota bacterium]
MDVSPRELRDTDIREGFRGYHRDDVDELLERAASTIEGLTERVRQATERLSSAEGSTGRNRETEEMLQRTLILAQKTADEAIAEAQERSRALLEESESRARSLVTDAEATARRIADSERQRLEAELVDLASRRDSLTGDVDALEKYESEYRGRLRKAIESELDSLGKFSGQHGERPSMHEIEVPRPREAAGNSGGRAPSQPTVELGTVDPFPKPPSEKPSPSGPPEAVPDWAGPGPDPTASEPVPAPQVTPSPELADFVPADEPLEPEVLDDDAFFATLREAVRDDAPLGPRDEHPEDHFDDDSGDAKRRFRRRR